MGKRVEGGDGGGEWKVKRGCELGRLERGVGLGRLEKGEAVVRQFGYQRKSSSLSNGFRDVRLEILSGRRR